MTEERTLPAPPPQFQARVLVAEDDPVNRRVAELALLRLGCRVALASDGGEAVAAATRERFDLVLMDWHMPGMDGPQAARAIRAAEACAGAPRVPIVAVTGDTGAGAAQAEPSRDMEDRLAKPYSLAELQRVLARWVPAAPPPPDATPPPAAASDATGSTLDPACMERLRRLDSAGAPGVVTQLIALWLHDAPRLLADIADACGRGDAARAHRAAHTLRSSSANLGATRLAALCREIELAARAGTAPPAGPQLAAEFDAVRCALQRELDAPPPGRA